MMIASRKPGGGQAEIRRSAGPRACGVRLSATSGHQFSAPCRGAGFHSHQVFLFLVPLSYYGITSGIISIQFRKYKNGETVGCMCEKKKKKKKTGGKEGRGTTRFFFSLWFISFFQFYSRIFNFACCFNLPTTATPSPVTPLA